MDPDMSVQGIDYTIRETRSIDREWLLYIDCKRDPLSSLRSSGATRSRSCSVSSCPRELLLYGLSPLLRKLGLSRRNMWLHEKKSRMRRR
jgi:hypothetical protein